jgi:hypothetical protein
VLGPSIAGYLRELATSSTERVLLFIGEVAPHIGGSRCCSTGGARWSPAMQALHTTAVVCRLRFRLLHRQSTTAPAPARRPRGLVLPRR